MSLREKSREIISNKYLPRFFQKIKITEDCWIWTASKRKSGYGLFKFNKKLISSHRFSWKIHFGEIPNGLNVCHKCDNPKHLFIGSQLDNMKDQIAKGRQRYSYGSSNGASKLNEKQIIELKNDFHAGVKRKDIARKYGISIRNIYWVVKGVTWKSVK